VRFELANDEKSVVLKIASVSPTMRVSGAERVTISLLRNDPSSPFIATALLGDENVASIFKDSGMAVQLLEGFKLFSAKGAVRSLLDAPFLAMRLSKAIRNAKPDLILVPNIPALFYVWLARGNLISPVVLHCQDYYQRAPRIIRTFAKLLRNYPKGIVAASVDVEKNLVSLGFPSERICTVQSGIDCNAILEKVRSDTLRIVICGYFEQWKGLHVAIEAIGKVRRRSEIEIFVVGSIPDADYKKRIIALSQGLRIHFVGQVKDPLEWFRKCDCLVHVPILPDPFPTVVLEGLASGCVVIVSDCGGAPEVIRDRENGFVCKTDCSNSIALCISEILEDRALLEKLSAEGRKTYLSNFTSDHFRSRFLSFCQRILRR
jgi:glycosyltransferase involved in cell wall biosynthesis